VSVPLVGRPGDIPSQQKVQAKGENDRQPERLRQYHQCDEDQYGKPKEPTPALLEAFRDYGSEKLSSGHGYVALTRVTAG